MATTDPFLNIYLKQAEKAHSILKFVYDFKKRKAILKKIRETIFAKHESGNILALYFMFHKSNKNRDNKEISFYELIRELKKQ